MAQLAHGTITVTDITDITDVYLQYALAISSATVTNSYTFSQTGEQGWNTTVPTWVSGFQIWVRQVTEKEGIQNPEYGTPYLDEAINQINVVANNALNIANGINQHFWSLPVQETHGTNTFAAGSYVTEATDTNFLANPVGKSNLLIRSTGTYLNNGLITLASFEPNALKFYDATGTTAQATFGGTQATISGTINVYDGKIGNNANNYWYIGNYTDYNQNNSAIIKSKGTASIQLDETNTWRISTNRIHTAWAPETGTDAFLLHYPKFNDSSSNNKYWDYGLHLPTSNSDKFLYIRNASGSETLDNLLNDLDDYGYNYWTYKFYIDGEGNIHAGDIYSHDTLISGTSAPYLLKSGGTITGALEVNGALTKGGKNVTYLTITPTNGQILIADGTSGGIKTSGYTIAKSVPSDAAFTDKNVQTSQANTTKIFLTGTSTSGTSTGTLSYDSNVYLTTTAGTLHATTFEGNLSGTATKANQDGDGNVIKTTYLKLSGGNVTGPVTFGSSVSADELTVGDLVVNGAASFTNNLQANTINGVSVGSSPKFTDTVATVTVTGNGNAVTTASASNGVVTLTKGTTFPTGSGTNGSLVKWTGTNTIGNGPAIGTGTTKFLREDGTWVVPGGTYSLPTASSSTLGGVKVGYTTSEKNYKVDIDSNGNLYVNVPWTNVNSNYVPTSRKVAGHALTGDITLSNSDVGLGDVINVKQITNITNEFVDGVNTGRLVIWRGDNDSTTLSVEITAREATSATNAVNAEYATYDASESGKTTKVTIANKYIAKSIGTAAGDIIYWSSSGTPVRLAKGTNGQVLKMVNNVPAWSTDNNTWDALSTSQAGYVAKAPNDTAKFLRGDASWAAVTKSNVGLGSVDNTADANKRVKGANITTSANAVAYYTDAVGTFGSKASANGALYATSDGGALSWGTLPIAQGGTGKTTALAAITNLGGPYILAQGTEITDSSNLDTDYTAAGTYYSPNSTRSASLSGTVVSVSSGFKMITMKGYREQNILQFANWNDDRLLYRYSYDATVNFGKWYQLVRLPSGSDNKTFAAIGGSTQPVYVNRDGVVTVCTSYANATVGKSNKTGAADLTTIANAIAYYIDTAGTFGSKASANGALYATSANGALNWGTLPVAQGGTGATAARTAFHNLTAGLTSGNAVPTDDTVFMCGNTNAATNDWYYRKMVHVWTYIKGKADSTYVTLAGDNELITGTKSFGNLLGTKYVATKGGAGCEINYDSTLEAIVFSFA